MPATSIARRWRIVSPVSSRRRRNDPPRDEVRIRVDGVGGVEGLKTWSWCDLDGGVVMNVLMSFERLMDTNHVLQFSYSTVYLVACM
jgi:hypothetical protein